LVGLGILAKYTMVLWIPSFALFLFTERARRHLVFRPRLWVLTGVAFLCSLPILIWNAQNNWVTFRHVGGQAGVTEATGIAWFGPVKFLSQQCVVFLIFWFLAYILAMVAYRPWKERDPQRQYLWWMSAPMFLNFLFFSFKNGGGQINWPVTAYTAGLILAIGWLIEQWHSPVAWWRRAIKTGFATSTAVGFSLVILMHFAVQAQPVLETIAKPAFSKEPYPLRKLDPTCRLRGWRHLAAHVDQVRARLHEQGEEEPVLMATTWRLPGELRFYCAGNPIVYSVGRAIGERWSQYDFWRPNPLHDDELFHGKTVILVGYGPGEALGAAFGEFVSSENVIYREDGEPIEGWNITVFRDFRGFSKVSSKHY
ncbi:MAG: hypothetical protein AB7K24_12505, partial [Gemmataceae bacterium]